MIRFGSLSLVKSKVDNDKRSNHSQTILILSRGRDPWSERIAACGVEDEFILSLIDMELSGALGSSIPLSCALAHSP